MKKLIWVLMVSLIFSGCTSNWTKHIVKEMDPVSLYDLYGESTKNLGYRSKCPSPPSLQIINEETRTGEINISPTHVGSNLVNPKEIMDAFVEYLKYGYKQSGIVVNDNSLKIIYISLEDAKLIETIANMKLKVRIPEVQYEQIYSDMEYNIFLYKAMAYATHKVSRQIINDSRVQDYIFCR